MELKKKILDSTIRIFRVKGLKFTMDDIAKDIGISKKTIYTVFADKEALFFNMVDYLFDGIKEEEKKVLERADLTTKEKIRKVLSVMPDTYKDLDFTQLFVLRQKYPDIYRQVEVRLENGWEGTIVLLEQGIQEGVIRPVMIPIFKMMMEASLEQFFSRDILKQNNISYGDALEEVVTILMEGILA